jgi:hypothetical protein
MVILLVMLLEDGWDYALAKYCPQRCRDRKGRFD